MCSSILGIPSFIFAYSSHKDDGISVRCYLKINGSNFICTGEMIDLEAPEGFDRYLWSNGSTDRILSVNKPGKYWVTAVKVVIINGIPEECPAHDTITINLKTFSPLNIGKDTALCKGESLILDVGPNFYLNVWSDNSTFQTNIVTKSGKYWVTAKSLTGDCETSDTIIIADRDFSGLRFITPTEDIPSCNDVELKAALTGKLFHDWKFQWFCDGRQFMINETDTAIVVKKVGNYQVKVFDPVCNQDTVLKFNYHPDLTDRAEIHIPNAFSPNNDNNNDRFKVFPISVCSFEITIFNRWGTKVFFSNHPNFEWDGTSQGLLAKEGTYVYQVKYTGISGNERIKTGTITLIY